MTDVFAVLFAEKKTPDCGISLSLPPHLAAMLGLIHDGTNQRKDREGCL